MSKALHRKLPHPDRNFHVFGADGITPEKLWEEAKKFCNDDGFSGEILVQENETEADDHKFFKTILAGGSTQGVAVNFITNQSRTNIHISLGLFASLGDVKLAFAYMYALRNLYPDCEIYYNENIDEGQFSLDKENVDAIFLMSALNIQYLLMNPADGLDTVIPGIFRELYLPNYEAGDEESTDIIFEVMNQHLALQWEYDDYSTPNEAHIESPDGEKNTIRVIANTDSVFVGACSKLGILNSKKQLKLVDAEEFIGLMEGDKHFKMVDNVQFVLEKMPTKDWDQLFDSLPGEEITGEPMRERKTYLLRWNPAISSFKMEAYKDALSTYPDGFGMDWSVYEWEEAQKGDRYYMLRVGEGNTGIVFYGEFTSDPYQGGDWAGKGKIRHYVDITCEDALDPELRPYATIEELEEAIPEIDWMKGHSGQLLTEEQADKIGEIISSHIK